MESKIKFTAKMRKVKKSMEHNLERLQMGGLRIICNEFLIGNMNGVTPEDKIKIDNLIRCSKIAWYAAWTNLNMILNEEIATELNLSFDQFVAITVRSGIFFMEHLRDLDTATDAYQNNTFITNKFDCSHNEIKERCDKVLQEHFKISWDDVEKVA